MTNTHSLCSLAGHRNSSRRWLALSLSVLSFAFATRGGEENELADIVVVTDMTDAGAALPTPSPQAPAPRSSSGKCIWSGSAATEGK